MHGTLLSVGLRANDKRATRIGLRTKRGLKGAVQRNRLKRQVRSVLRGRRCILRPGIDLVIVIHPPKLPEKTNYLEFELVQLCRRCGALSQRS